MGKQSFGEYLEQEPSSMVDRSRCIFPSSFQKHREGPQLHSQLRLLTQDCQRSIKDTPRDEYLHPLLF